MIAKEIAQYVLDSVSFYHIPSLEGQLVVSFLKKHESIDFMACHKERIEVEWTFMLLVAHALGYENPETMENYFTLTDPDLDTLVNLGVDLAQGHGSMDIGIMWAQALDNLNARLGVCQEKRNG